MPPQLRRNTSIDVYGRIDTSLHDLLELSIFFGGVPCLYLSLKDHYALSLWFIVAT